MILPICTLTAGVLSLFIGRMNLILVLVFRDFSGMV